MSTPDKYGCHNRPPIQTFGNPQCQYTYTWLGQIDKRCEGCKHKEVQNNGKTVAKKKKKKKSVETGLVAASEKKEEHQQNIQKNWRMRFAIG